MKSIFYLLLIIFCSCTQSETQKKPCDVDLRVKERFDYHFNYMKENFKDNRAIGNDMIISLSFMMRLTGIESNVVHGDITMYNEYKDFEEDMDNWRIWYVKNKCKVTRNQIDSLEESLRRY